MPIEYRRSDRLNRLPLSDYVIGSLAGRSEVRSALADDESDVRTFFTQVPAVIGGRRARSRPYVIVTDVTPTQLDSMAEAYGHHVDRNGPVKWAKRHLNRRMFQRATWCVAWSQWTARSMIDDYGVDPDRVAIIPIGIDLDVWTPGPNPVDDGPCRLLFVGGEFERKGGYDLLAAFERLRSDVELTVVTKSAVPPTERVTVVDDLAPNDIRLRDLYRASDVFVLPTYGDTFGIAAVEAGACGLPVVTTGLGGMPDIVKDGETGLYAPPRDVDELQAALQRLVDDPDLRRKMGAAGHDHVVDNFDSATNYARLVDLIHRSARPR